MVLVATVCPEVPRLVLPLVLIHLFWHWCSAMLGHFYYRYPHVEVCRLGESSEYTRTHHPNALAAINRNLIYSVSSHSKY